jgi:transposase
MRRTTIVELLAELRSLDRKRKTINAELTRALDDYGTCLTNIDGIGPVAAATIISIVGDVRRFPNAGHFASFTGTAPVAASSGEVVRYRLNLGGQREMNKVLHVAVRVQSNMPTSDGRVYLHRKLAGGKTRAEAIRSLKRHLANVVYRAEPRPDRALDTDRVRCELLVETEPLKLLAGHGRDDVEVLVVVENREARQLGGRRDQ